MKYHYMVDTKLIAYYLYQRGSNVHYMLDKIASILFDYPKGEIYLAFDIGKSQYRLNIHSGYKGHRNKNISPEDKLNLEEFNKNYINFSELCAHIPAHILAVPGVEADDLISMVTFDLQKDISNKIYLVTADMDYINSVAGNSNVRIIDVFKKEVLTSADVYKSYGIKSRREFNIRKSLVGDESDNIKFVKGIGPVKAQEIFDSVHTAFDEPSDEDVINAVENYMKQFPKLKVHSQHTEQGRTTVSEAYIANMSIVDTFTDTSKMTPEQIDIFNRCLARNKPPEIKYNKLLQLSLDTLGFPVSVNDITARIFKIKG